VGFVPEIVNRTAPSGAQQLMLCPVSDLSANDKRCSEVPQVCQIHFLRLSQRNYSATQVSSHRRFAVEGFARNVVLSPAHALQKPEVNCTNSGRRPQSRWLEFVSPSKQQLIWEVCSRSDDRLATTGSLPTRVCKYFSLHALYHLLQHRVSFVSHSFWASPGNVVISYIFLTRCRLPERFASAWPELIIACDVRGRGEWLHRCSWPPLQLACAACRLFAHTFHEFRLQTDRQKNRQTAQPGYILRLSLYRGRMQKTTAVADLEKNTQSQKLRYLRNV